MGMKSFLCELILSCMLAAPGAKPIDELTYGTVLFSYYQQDYNQALLDTLVAERQGRRGENVVRFDLAKGSFAFGDGMYAYSRATFAAIDQQELTDVDRMRMAFHLAREYHRRGDYPEVSAQLAKIDLGKGFFGRDKSHPEVEFMRSEVHLQQGDFAEAAVALDRLDKEDSLRAYGLFNLGVAQRSNNDLGAARDTFGLLAAMSSDRDEVFDLKQRAKLALAFIAREQNDTTSAEAVLSALPGSGRYRDIALAAYGGLAMDNGDYELAARIWLTLQQQDYWSTSTAQARLGFPVSLERLASQEMALVQYREAARGFEARLAKLNTLSENAQDPEWVNGLLLAFSAPEQDDEQMGDLMERWRAQLGHTDWLEWLATEDVHEVLVQWRELLSMQDWLTQLPDRLDAYQEVSTEQQRRSGQAREMLYDRGFLEKRGVLHDQLAVLETQLENLRASTPVPDIAWMSLLADPSEQQLLDDLERMQGLVDAHFSAADRVKWLRRIERLRGVLFWSLANDSSARIRALAKKSAGTAELLVDLDQRVARVQSAKDHFASGVATDFQQFAQRADMIATRVDHALNGREEMLAAEIRRGMQREMLEVREYLLVARIAIARATDQLAHSGVGELP
jgi:hypothetical protein